ncbi:MAG: fasciclin domain-containing protein [Candidatus Promineifilaceae bacterium]
MKLSRQGRAVSFFGLIALLVLLIGRTTHAETYETSLMDVLEADGRFTTYIGALEQTGLDQMIKYNGSFTLLAPTDAAFNRMSAEDRGVMFSNTNTLRQTLLHHMLLSKWRTETIGSWEIAHSLLGKQMQVRMQGGMLILDEARVINANVSADNGLIHMINGVLIPPGGSFDSRKHGKNGQQKTPNNNGGGGQQTPRNENGSSSGESPLHTIGTIYEILVAEGRFRTLMSVTNKAGLSQMLNRNGPFTLFAPTNAAFNALPKGTLDALMADQAAVRQLLLHHMVQGKFETNRLETLRTLRTALGENVEITHQGNAILIDGARITLRNIEATNGTIHVIDAVVMR